MFRRTAIIITGNPARTSDRARAEAFYRELASFLESLEFPVAFDAGEPYTVPAPADLWVGHSRGADRLRFAPPGTMTIGIGVPPTADGTSSFPVVNHHDDAAAKCTFRDGVPLGDESSSAQDDRAHFELTEGMKASIAAIISRGAGAPS